MKKYIPRLSLVIIVVLVTLCVVGATLVFADGWEYSVEVTIQDTGGSDRTNVPLLLPISGDDLVSAGFLAANATDSRCLEGTTERGYGIHSHMVGVVLPTLSAYQTRAVDLRTGYSPVESDFFIVFGANQSYGLVEPDYYTVNEDIGINIYGTTWAAQTFTTSEAYGDTYGINRVRLKLYKVGSPGTINIAILATSSSLPTGADLTTGSLADGGVTTDTDGAWYDIDLTEYDLSDDTLYAIIVKATSGDSDNKVVWLADETAPGYAGGDWCNSADSGSNWTENTGTDALFEVYRNSTCGMEVTELNAVEIASSDSGGGVTNRTSHTVDMPSGVESGDLIVVLFSSDGNPTITFPGGWTELTNTYNHEEYYGYYGDFRFGTWYRISDGSEGSSITVTTSDSEKTSWQSFRITGSEGNPEASTPTTGADPGPDPGSLDATWDGDALWIATCGWERGTSQDINNYPSGYSDGAKVSGSGSDGVGVARAIKIFGADSEDAGNFALDNLAYWTAVTLQVKSASTLRPYNEDFTVEWSGYLDTTQTGSIWEQEDKYGLEVSSSGTVKGYAGTPEVTASVESGSHTIILERSGTTLSLTVDGSEEDTDTISSAIDHDTDAMEMDGCTVMATEYVKVSVDSSDQLWLQPIEMLTGNSIDDRSDNDFDADVEWGSNQDVTIVIGETTTYDATTPSESGSDSLDSDTLRPAGQPGSWYGFANDITGLPFYEQFNSISAELGMPVQTLYLMIMLGVASAVGLGVLLFTGSQLLTAIGTGFVLFLGQATGVLGLWMVFVYAIIAAGILYLSRQY